MVFIIEEAKKTVLDFSQGTIIKFQYCKFILLCYTMIKNDSKQHFERKTV